MTRLLFLQEFKFDWEDQEPTFCTVGKCSPWVIFPWGYGYWRIAREAYKCPNRKCRKDQQCRKRVSISDLLFGRTKIRVEDTLECGYADPAEIGTAYNPYVGAMDISPHLEYQDRGLMLGTNMHTEVRGGKVLLGFRARIPYRVIDMRPVQLEEEDPATVVSYPASMPKGHQPDAQIPLYTDYAFRNDFFRSAFTYGDGTHPTTILAPDFNTTPPGLYSQLPISGDNVHDVPVFVVKRTNDTPPCAEQVPGAAEGIVRFGKTTEQVKGPLPADCSGCNNEVFYFDNKTDYSCLKNGNCQRTLFIVPCIEPKNNGSYVDFCDTAEATRVRNGHQCILANAAAQESAAVFFYRNMNINFRDREVSAGVGDLKTDIYLGFRKACSSLYISTGVSFPTGRRLQDARRIYYVTTGRNGHPELYGGLEGGAWANVLGINTVFTGSAYYYHVLPANELRAAPFCGAKTKNIGPNIPTNVRWHYWIIRGLLTGFLSRCVGTGINNCMGLGATLDYEFWNKSKDKVKLLCNTACDVFCRQKPLDKYILEECTDSQTHKMRAEAFLAWNYGKFYLGGSYIFAGKNALVETEIYLGFTASF